MYVLRQQDGHAPSPSRRNTLKRLLKVGQSRRCLTIGGCGTLGPMDSLPSTIGPYRIIRQLGEGGMGRVYEAVHQAIERRVAIKVLLPEYVRRADFAARFFNEARAANRIEHPGIVQVSEYGQQPDGTAYIVMEYLRGESLAARLKRRGKKLPVAEVIHLSAQITASLVAAHEKGITHRDVSWIDGDCLRSRGKTTQRRRQDHEDLQRGEA